MDQSLCNIYEKVNKCDRCKLCKNRIVDCSFRGSEKSSIMFVGEAQGKNECEKGKPFIGRSGKLLDKLLQTIGFNVEKDIYITNLVKDRPIDPITGKDRKPFYDEIVACAPYLLEEIELLKPKLIITLGKTSGDWFANYEPYEINKFYPERKWLSLYHPAYLARSKEEIPKFVEAIKETLKKIGNNV